VSPDALAFQQLGSQVVADVSVVSREGFHGCGEVAATAKRQRRQVKCGRPAVGSGLQALHGLAGQARPQLACEEGRGLACGEAERVRPKLSQVTLRSQPGQRQRRNNALTPPSALVPADFRPDMPPRCGRPPR
jgi:hypothetical protein